MSTHALGPDGPRAGGMSRQPPAPTPSVVMTALRRAAGVYTACILTAWLVAPFASYAAPARGALLALTTLAAALAVVGWFRRPPWPLTAATLLAGLALYLAARLTTPAPAPALLALLLGYLLLVVAALIPRHQIVVGAVVAVPVVWVELTRPATTATAQAVGPAVAIAVAALLMLPLANRIGDRLARTAEERVRAERGAAEEEGRLAAHREAQAILHDEVLAALRTVASPDVDRAAATAGAASAWNALVATAEPVQTGSRDLVAALRSLRVPGLRVRFTGDVAGPLVLPSRVAQALRRATAEALRNVARHAGVSQATVQVLAQPDGARVEVHDSGRGFDVHDAPASYGLRQSVRVRLTAIGGRAEVRSRPGQGTVVALAWAQPDEEGPAREGLDRAALSRAAADAFARTVGDARRPAAAMIGPFAALALAYAALGLRHGQPLWLGAWALALTAIGGYLLYRGERSISPPRHELMHAFALIGVAAYLAQAPVQVITTYQGWPVSLAALAGAVTAALRSGWRAIGVTVALVAVVALFAVLAPAERSLTSLVPAVPAMLSVCWPVLLTTTMRYGLALLSDRDEREAALTRTTLAQEASTMRRRTALDQRLSHLRALLDPTLGAIARGELDVRDPQVQRAAAAAERVARDELNLPWALTPELTRAVQAARGRGVEVVLTTTSDLVRTPPVAAAMLTAALTPTARRLALTVPSDSATVTLVAEIDDDGERELAHRALVAAGAQVRAIATTLLARAAPDATGPARPVADTASPAPGN